MLMYSGSHFWLGDWVVLSLGLAVSLVWAVVVVVEEMLCANSKMRLLAHNDLTWKNLWVWASALHGMYESFCGF